MIRDPSSADANAQAPQGHPDAQVRIDTTSRLAGTQQPKLPAGAPMASAPAVPAVSQDANAAPSEAAAAAPAAPAVPVEPEADPIPAGEVTPDVPPSAQAADADPVG